MNGQNVLNYIDNVSKVDDMNSKENDFKMSDIY